MSRLDEIRAHDSSAVKCPVCLHWFTPGTHAVQGLLLTERGWERIPQWWEKRR